MRVLSSSRWRQSAVVLPHENAPYVVAHLRLRTPRVPRSAFALMNVRLHLFSHHDVHSLGEFFSLIASTWSAGTVVPSSSSNGNRIATNGKPNPDDGWMSPHFLTYPFTHRKNKSEQVESHSLLRLCSISCAYNSSQIEMPRLRCPKQNHRRSNDAQMSIQELSTCQGQRWSVITYSLCVYRLWLLM